VDVLLKLQGDSRYKLSFWFPNYKPLVNNQHHIINKFIQGEFDFWLSIDSDTVPMNNPLDLVEFNRDIIGLPYPVWHVNDKNERPYYWAAYDYVKETDDYSEHRDSKGLQQVDAIGGGCFLVSARVFLNKEMQKGAFTRKLNPDGTVRRGNDISFCERAKENGFEIFTHYGYPCRHYYNIDMVSMIKAFGEVDG
jgi:hypothetical protein